MHLHLILSFSPILYLLTYKRKTKIGVLAYLNSSRDVTQIEMKIN